VPTGLQVAIPEGHVGLVWPRSGLAVRHGIDTLAGVIDSDYRGELRVVLVNHGDEPFRVAPGERIAQLLVQRVERAVFTRAERLDETARGTGGFGSTGR
jgi:dUTP pyrophosphatase